MVPPEKSKTKTKSWIKFWKKLIWHKSVVSGVFSFCYVAPLTKNWNLLNFRYVAPLIKNWNLRNFPPALSNFSDPLRLCIELTSFAWLRVSSRWRVPSNSLKQQPYSHDMSSREGSYFRIFDHSAFGHKKKSDNESPRWDHNISKSLNHFMRFFYKQRRISDPTTIYLGLYTHAYAYVY